MRKTKIICTLGPSSGSEEVIKELFKVGRYECRANEYVPRFSCGSPKKYYDISKSKG